MRSFMMILDCDDAALAKTSLDLAEEVSDELLFYNHTYIAEREVTRIK